MSHADNPDCIDCREPRAMTPTTTAGRALLADPTMLTDDGEEAAEEAIDAIEREAAAAERERIRSEIGPDMYASLAPYIRAILAEPSDGPQYVEEVEDRYDR